METKKYKPRQRKFKFPCTYDNEKVVAMISEEGISFEGHFGMYREDFEKLIEWYDTRNTKREDDENTETNVETD